MSSFYIKWLSKLAQNDGKGAWHLRTQCECTAYKCDEKMGRAKSPRERGFQCRSTGREKEGSGVDQLTVGKSVEEQTLFMEAVLLDN